MALQNDLDLLLSVDLFQGFPEEQLRLLAFGTERELLRAGRELFRLGDASNGGYVIAGGQIDMIMFRGHREIILDSGYQGGLIGELGLITQAIRSTNAVARTNSEVMFIPRTLFHRMLNTYPESAAILHQRISLSVHRMLEQLHALRDSIDAAPKFQTPKPR